MKMKLSAIALTAVLSLGAVWLYAGPGLYRAAPPASLAATSQPSSKPLVPTTVAQSQRSQPGHSALSIPTDPAVPPVRQNMSNPTKPLSTALTTVDPTIGIISVTPSTVRVSKPTVVTVTVTINNPLLLVQSVDLVRLGGATSTIVGQFRDDGLGGDAVSGDHIVTTQIVLDESEPGAVQLLISAALKGVLRRVTSAPVEILIQGVLLSDVVNGTPFVVQGTISSVTQYYMGGYIFSDLQLGVANIIKGTSLPSSIVVKTLGGVVGADSQLPMQSAGMAIGQQVLLFLDGPGSDGKYFLSYGPIGEFRVQVVNGQAVAVVDPSYTFTDTEMSPSLDPVYSALLSQSSSQTLSLASLITAIRGQ